MDDVYTMLSTDEMTILKEHYKAVQEKQLSEKKWTPERKRVVARLYERIRAKGYRLVGQYPSGSPKFAVIQKSAIEQIMELSEEDFNLYRSGHIRFIGGRLHRAEEACQ